MSRADFIALLPHAVLLAGILVLMLWISFRRGPNAACVVTVLVLLATLVAVVPGLQGGARVVLGFVRLDGFAAFFNVLFLVSAGVTALLAQGYLRGRAGEQEEFYLLVLTTTLGAMVLASADHFGAFLLGLEIMSVSLYVLIAYCEEGHAPLEAALKYLVLSGVASTTLLFGMALLYMATGCLSLSTLAATVDGPFQWHLLAGHGLLIAGLAFKLSLVPFHMWTPDVMQGAPAPVTGFLATVSKAGVFAFLLRYVGATDVLADAGVFRLVLVFAVLSMVAGNLLALMQTQVKRTLAYSSVAHAGYVLIAVLALARIADVGVGVEAGMVYLAGYVIMTLAAFGVVAALSDAREGADADALEAFTGLFWQRPLAAVVLTTALLALAGLPLTVGFIAKFYLFSAGVEGELWLAVWALVTGSAIAIYYYLRIILTMTRVAAEPVYAFAAPAPAGATALVMLGFALIVLGVYPAPLIDVVSYALRIGGG